MTAIGIHLTAWAPGCADLPRLHPDLWPWLEGASADDVIHWLEHRLDRPTNHFALRAEGNETVVYARVDGEDKPVLMAVIHTGATFSDLTKSRQSLVQESQAA